MDQLAAAMPESGFAEMSLPDAFARVAAARGGRRAVASAAWQATYAELDTAANRLAHAMLGDGVAPGDRVAILMQHDTPLIAAMLAVLKAGAVVVVLNPGHPDARLRQTTDDAAAALLLVDAANRARAGAVGGCAHLCFEDRWRAGPSHDPGLRIAPEALAVLTYTSGSSGQPKAVMQAHRRILHNAFRLSSGMGVAAEDRIALLASLSGGQGMGTAWCALANGASLWPFATTDKGVVGLADWMIEHAISVYVSSASLFRNFVSTLDGAVRFPQVRVVRLASEFATWDDVAAFRRHFPLGCSLIHTLSSSETGNMAQFSVPGGTPLGTGRLPVGRPAPGMEILLVDDEGRPVRPGEAGEIVARSRYLAGGYWRNPALTAERFAEDPGGLRSYRSGDRARVNAEGLLEFVGREDDRVKVRGHRIELSEVEEAVLKLPGVAAAAVCLRSRAGAEPLLAAFVVAEGVPPAARELREALRDRVPDHMVPSAFAFLDALPLTPHGKIDRVRLLQISLPPLEAGAVDAPRGEIEQRLAAIWIEALALPAVGRSADFFQLGGDSLIAVVIAARVHAAFAVELHLATFVEHPTVAAQARAIERMQCGAALLDGPASACAPRDGPAPLSFIQERIWRFSQDPRSAAAYTVANCDDITGPLDPVLLRDCLSAIVARHEILRTGIGTLGGEPVQIVHAAAPVDLPLHDLSGHSDVEARAARLLRGLAAHTFDLARPPLMRFALIRLAAARHWLVTLNHHVISDGWSRRILLRELAAHYAAGRHGARATLPAPLQYCDYAAWQRERLRRDGTGYAERIAWWSRHMAAPPPPMALPFRRPDPSRPADPARGRISRRLDPEVSRRLRDLKRRHGATDYVVWLATVAALLSRISGSEDLVIGTYVTNRNRLALQDMLGCFVNLVPMRLGCDPRLRVPDWLTSVCRTVAAAEARADIPFEQLREDLAARGIVVPEIAVIFSDSYRRDQMRFADLCLTRLEKAEPAMPWGFSIVFDERAGAYGLRIAFDAGLYDPDDVVGFSDRLCRLLDLVSRRDDLSLRELVALSDAPHAER